MSVARLIIHYVAMELKRMGIGNGFDDHFEVSFRKRKGSETEGKKRGKRKVGNEDLVRAKDMSTMIPRHDEPDRSVDPGVYVAILEPRGSRAIIHSSESMVLQLGLDGPILKVGMTGDPGQRMLDLMRAYDYAYHPRLFFRFEDRKTALEVEQYAHRLLEAFRTRSINSSSTEHYCFQRGGGIEGEEAAIRHVGDTVTQCARSLGKIIMW